MLSPSFFFILIDRFQGVDFYIEDPKHTPEHEIGKIRELYDSGLVSKEELLKQLGKLTVYRYLFSIDGDVWNPVEQSFREFVKGNVFCMCAELPESEEAPYVEGFSKYIYNLAEQGNVLDIKHFRG